MVISSAVREERTYSAGTVPRSEGLLGLSWPAMISGGIVVVTTMLAQLIGGLAVAGIVLGVGAITTGPLMVRVGGRSGYERLLLTMQWLATVRRGEHLYRGGAFSAIPGSAKLPGLLAATRLYEGRDVAGYPFAMVHLPAKHEYTIVLACWPQGGEAVDQPIVDGWVAAWGNFIATLGASSDIRAVVPVIDTIPETGNRLLAEIETLTRPDAPEVAREVMWSWAPNSRRRT